MTTAQRKATRRYRERRRKRGLKRVEVLVPANSVEAIRAAAAVLRGAHPSVKTGPGSIPKPADTYSAIDMFAMQEPLSPRGEALWEEVMAQAASDRDAALMRRVAAELRRDGANAERLRSTLHAAVAETGGQPLAEVLYDPAIAGPEFDEVFEEIERFRHDPVMMQVRDVEL